MNVRQLALSGELLRIAAGCKTWSEVARCCGVGVKTLHSALERMRLKGERYPSIEEIAAGAACDTGVAQGVQHDAYGQHDFADEEPTTPGVIGKADNRWPHLEAFDALEGEEPPLPAIPKGHRVDKLSTLVDASTGEAKLQWIKTSANQNDVDPVELLRLAFGDSGAPRAEPVDPPAHSMDDLLAAIVFGDPHFGQLSWHRDAGENFDLAIAERNMVRAVEMLVALAPDAAQCLLVWIGDNTHSDGPSNTTTKGTRVDVDGRTTKMIAVTVRAFRRAIDLSLAKFGRAHCIVERGNHDYLISSVIALALQQAYEGNERVTIDDSPEAYHFYRFGQNLIGTHHGDRAKPLDLLGVMANDRAKDWGETKHRRWYCGHIHHEVVKEVPGVTVEYMRTLAPADAWHRAQGYRAGRDLRLDVFHREYGLVNRHIVGIQQITEAA